MDKFEGTYNLPKLNQEETENLNRMTKINGTKAVIKKLPTASGQDGGIVDTLCLLAQPKEGILQI